MRKLNFLITVALTSVLSACAAVGAVEPTETAAPTSVPSTPTTTPAPAPTPISPCRNPTSEGWKLTRGESVEILLNLKEGAFLWVISLNSSENPSEANAKLSLLDPNNPGWGWFISEEIIPLGKVLTNDEKTTITVRNPDMSVGVISLLKCPRGIYSQYHTKIEGEVDG